ncbi:MAG: hypothetical protein PW734_07880 [Verrucomicrobium sp.]|nr:hypothetical protein [Verrucomicrobium sp.]
MNARSWFLVGAQLLALYLFITAVSDLPAAVPPHGYFERFSGNSYRFEALLLRAVLAVILMFSCQRLADVLGFKETERHASANEEGIIRGALTVLGIWWTFTGGLALASALLLSPFFRNVGGVLPSFLHFLSGFLLFAYAGKIARWAVRIRR